MTAAPALVTITRAEFDHAQDELNTMRRELLALRNAAEDDRRTIVGLRHEAESLARDLDFYRSEHKRLAAASLEHAAIRRAMRPGETWEQAKARRDSVLAAMADGGES